jgi:hypothetical protein
MRARESVEKLHIIIQSPQQTQQAKQESIDIIVSWYFIH